jgi:hypothetical protein
LGPPAPGPFAPTERPFTNWNAAGSLSGAPVDTDEGEALGVALGEGVGLGLLWRKYGKYEV